MNAIEPPTSARRCAGIRTWYPLALIVLLALCGIVAVQWVGVTFTGKPIADIAWILGIANVAVYVWVRAFSRTALRSQITVLSIVAGLQMAAYCAIRLDGFVGDGRPHFVWRWSPSAKDQWAISQAAIAKSPPITSRSRAAVLRTDRADSPSFRGADRSGVYGGSRRSRDWTRPPELLWKRPIGLGWSSFAVVGDRCYTQEQRAEFETVVCYDLLTGEQIWEHRDRTCFEEVTGGAGPRATPSVAGGRVYSLGATGILNCLDANTGEVAWSKNILDDCAVTNRLFGMAGSPLVMNGVVVVSPGGKDASLVAYDRQTGKRVWHGGTEEASYSSPHFAAFRTPQILLFNAAGLFGHEAESGRVLWSYPWVSNPAEKNNVCQPIPLPGGDEQADRVFISSGYGKGCALFEICERDQQFSVERLWANQNLKTKFTSAVHRTGCIYGLDDQILVCLDVATGRRCWKGGHYGYGQVVLIDDLLLVQAESGEVALVEASPQGHREIGRFAALDSKTWNHPVVAGNLLLVRNDREAACYLLPMESEEPSNEL